MTAIRTAIGEGEALLTAAGVPDAKTDAQYLLAHVLHTDRLQLLLNAAEALSEDALHTYRALLQKRAERVPLQYLTGEQSFYGLDFYVDERVLIPRPETELLVELVLRQIAQMPRPRVLDLCTGSGAIAVAVKQCAGHADVFAADLSGDALIVARRNAESNRAMITFWQGDLFAAVPPTEAPFDVIVSNPPYITAADCQALQPEVMREPQLALNGGIDGLDFYRRIAREAPNHLAPDGLLAVEIGDGEGIAVAALFAENGFANIAVHPDLSGIERIVTGYNRNHQ